MAAATLDSGGEGSIDDLYKAGAMAARVCLLHGKAVLKTTLLEMMGRLDGYSLRR